MRRHNFTINRGWLLLLAFLMLPYMELSAFLWVSARLGAPLALMALASTSFFGFWLVRRFGRSEFERCVRSISRRQAPPGMARDGLLAALGVLLIIVPGFITDCIGLILIIPACVRGLWRGPDGPSGPEGGGHRQTRVIDLDRTDWTRDDSAFRG